MGVGGAGGEAERGPLTTPVPSAVGGEAAASELPRPAAQVKGPLALRWGRAFRRAAAALRGIVRGGRRELLPCSVSVGPRTSRDIVSSGKSQLFLSFFPPQGAMPPKNRGRGKLPVPLPRDMILKDTEGKVWRLGSQIGQGGFGLIYLGKILVMIRRVTRKFLCNFLT